MPAYHLQDNYEYSVNPFGVTLSSRIQVQMQSLKDRECLVCRDAALAIPSCADYVTAAYVLQSPVIYFKTVLTISSPENSRKNGLRENYDVTSRQDSGVSRSVCAKLNAAGEPSCKRKSFCPSILIDETSVLCQSSCLHTARVGFPSSFILGGTASQVSPCSVDVGRGFIRDSDL